MIAVMVIIFLSRNNVSPSFYFWKTKFLLSEKDKQLLDSLKVKDLYVRFFDIDFKEGDSNPVLLGKVDIPVGINIPYTIVPVIYITNGTLKKTSLGNLPFIAGIILSEVKTISSNHSLVIKELQIDCDWSETTRDKYFSLLNLLRNKLHAEKKTISSTIRLHQIKYFRITGVPPVDKGMLMFYNMGSITADTNQTSIFNSSEAEKYVNYINNYPLRFDVALPIFSHVIHIREKRPIELLSKSFIDDLTDNSKFRKISNNYYICDDSFFFHGKYFIKNDSFKIEEVTSKIILEAALLLEKHLSSSDRTITLFDFDQENNVRYRYEDFKKIFNCFN